ncbi:MAG: hypothetical protein JO076_16520 [Verrucomicrobia bacterium]|nr:hypothetical protein [Verrucomicrobiota bacterium]
MSEKCSVDRRTFAALGVSAVVSAVVGSARVQSSSPPTPENLKRELPSRLQAAPVDVNLPELPSAQPDGLSERLFAGFKSQEVNTSGARIRVLMASALQDGSNGPCLKFPANASLVTRTRLAPRTKRHTYKGLD